MLEDSLIGPLERVELRVVGLPLLAPFATATGAVEVRELLLVHLTGEGLSGWGECVAFSEPFYTSETVATARHVTRELLVPALRRSRTVGEMRAAFATVRGHPMAKAAVEGAVLDLLGRRLGRPLWALLGGSPRRLPAAAAIGLEPTVEALVEAVTEATASGYRSVKLKVRPGWDVEAAGAVRRRFPGLPVWVDANGSYAAADLPALQALDGLGLQMIEQPFAADDLVGHARLQARLHTPICLDESVSCRGELETAVALGACRVLNLKPGRVGGLLAARELARLAGAHGLKVWVGGMLESGLGRASSLHLQTLPEVDLPGDLSAPARYLCEDLVSPSPALDREGCLVAPEGPGVGVEVREDILARHTLSREQL